jgi:hypothetical protein
MLSPLVFNCHGKMQRNFIADGRSGEDAIRLKGSPPKVPPGAFDGDGWPSRCGSLQKSPQIGCKCQRKHDPGMTVERQPGDLPGGV